MDLQRWMLAAMHRVRSLVWREAAEQDLDDEMEFHLHRQTQENIARGMNPEEARLAALRSMGGVEQRKEECRDTRRVQLVENVLRDLRYAARMLRKAPGFTAVAVVSLALGIGANTAVFTLINAVLLRPLPVPDPKELVEIKAERKGEWDLLSYPMYMDLVERGQVFTGMAATAGETPVRLTIPGPNGSMTELDNMRVAFVTANYFGVLRVAPALGRLLVAEDDRNPGSSETVGSVVVLSYAFWEQQFGRDPAVLDRTLLIGRSPARVVGVAPKGFTNEAVGSAPIAWVPLVPFTGPGNMDNRRGTFTAYLARLKPGIQREQAQAAMTVLFQQLLAGEGRVRDNVGDHVIVLRGASTGIDNSLRRKFGGPLRIIMGVVALVLLIACANVANLLLARAVSRRGEIGVRLATGCSRRRLIAQLLTESLLLSALGGLAGVAAGYWGSRALLQMMSGGPASPRLDLSPDWLVMAFLAGLCLVTGIGFGLAPALHATRVDVATALKGAARAAGAQAPRQRLGRVLVSLQVAISLLLVAGASLLLRSFHNLYAQDLGFRPEHVVIFDLAHNPQRREPPALANTAIRVHDRVKQVPGVDSASVSGLLLFSDSDIGLRVKIRDEGAPEEPVGIRFNSVSPDYFQTVGMDLVGGRSFDTRDSQNAAPVAVINRSMERRYFPRGAIGRFMEITSRSRPGMPVTIPNANQPIEIVGVVRDSKYNDLRQDTKPMFYVPFAQLPRSLRSLEVRTRQPAAAIASPVRQALAEISKDIMIRRVVTLSEQVDQSLAAESLVMRLCTFFGFLALLLACVGLYGVMAYAVAGRTAEIGIRMALGATPSAVARMVLREGTLMVLAGIAMGIPAVLAAGRLIASLLFGVTASDFVTIAGAALIMLAVAAVAGALPAGRAARIDPMTALRCE